MSIESKFSEYLGERKFKYEEDDKGSLTLFVDRKSVRALIDRKPEKIESELYTVYIDFAETEEGDPELIVQFGEGDELEFGENVPVANIKDPFWREIARIGLGKSEFPDWDLIFSDPNEYPIESAIQSGTFNEEEIAILKKMLIKAIERQSVEQQKKLLKQFA